MPLERDNFGSFCNTLLQSLIDHGGESLYALSLDKSIVSTPLELIECCPIIFEMCHEDLSKSHHRIGDLPRLGLKMLEEHLGDVNVPSGSNTLEPEFIRDASTMGGARCHAM